MILYCTMLLSMTLMGAIASLFLKKASGTGGLMGMIKNINLYIGGGLYLSSAVLNIVVLRKMDYSVVFPMTSVTYIWTMVLSFLFLGEKMTKRKLVGVFMISFGAVWLVY